MLPELRERVIAVALLLAMSVSMLGSASFAWLTISRRPEVTGANTTIAANGNLEIALATGEKEPDESKVGDSSATEGQTTAASNVTWGNLVNLSDPSYGLDHLILRPARLNEDDLLGSPLFSAAFTTDGRVENLTSNFEYTSWIQPEVGDGYFGLSNQLGVRAISSTKMDATDATFLRYRELSDGLAPANEAAKGTFDGIMANEDWMDLLAKVMGYHMCYILEPSKPDYGDQSITWNELDELRKMYLAFISAFEQEANAMAKVINFQLYALNGGDENTYEEYTAEDILTFFGNSISSVKKNGTRNVSFTSGKGTATLTGTEALLYDYYLLKQDAGVMQAKLDEKKDSYKWQTDGMKDLITNLVNINACLIRINGSSEEKTVSSFLSGLTSDITGASKYMNAEVVATINNGVIYDFCKFSGVEMDVTRQNSNGKKGLPISAGMVADSFFNTPISTTVYATIKTNAPTGRNSVFGSDMARAKNIEFKVDSSQMTIMAQDTYALAVDLWVRTNAEASYLTLEGNVLTTSHNEPMLGKNAASEDVPLYNVTRTTQTDQVDPETGKNVVITKDYTLYPEKTATNDDGYLIAATDNAKWYDTETFEVFTLETGETPAQKLETITEVIGFEGENRVWDRDNNASLTVDATTQGSGSCYVYYADTPEDMARSLELLKAMNVAFINDSGELLANAVMDTESVYVESGRVIVPLVLETGTPEVGTDENAVRVITQLEKNEPTRITALVYLDGTLLTNENVLSAAEIQGQLNIQFGSNANLTAISNEELELAERRVTASVSKSQFNFDTDTDLTTKVSVLVSGEQPSSVSAFFIRKINDTQGSREPVMQNFVFNDATSSWECDYTFNAPGTYILRTVQLDGQEYPLPFSDETPLPTVTVNGFTITSLDFYGTNLNVNNRKFSVMTADSTANVNLVLKFGSDDQEKMPSTVNGRFLRADGTAVNVTFNYDINNSRWIGAANFLASGEYTFQYVVLDGKYTELPEGMPITATISLGMKVAVYNNLPSKLIKIDPDKMTDDQKLLKMYVDIMDSSGQTVPGLTDAWLYYNHASSNVDTMDAKLRWDATAGTNGMYYGELKTFEAAGAENDNQEFIAELGRWLFNSVKVGSNTITNATSAPVFRLVTPASPEFVANTSNTSQFAPTGGEAAFTADIKFSQAATTMALVKHTLPNGTANQYYIIGDETSGGTTSTWTFHIPNLAAQSGTSETVDGYWMMQEIYVWDYLNEEDREIVATLNTAAGEWTDYKPNDWLKVTATDSLTVGGEYSHFTIAEKQVKVIQTPNVSFADLDNGDHLFEGKFLDTHTIGLTDAADTRVRIQITDFEGKPIAIKEDTIELSYNYDGNTSGMGGYTSNSVSGTVGLFKMNFQKDTSEGADGTVYIQKENKTVQYAGTYSPGVLKFSTLKEDGTSAKAYEYGSNGKPVLPAGIPTFTVQSDVPYVKFTATNPAEGTTFDVAYNKNPTGESDVKKLANDISDDGYSVTCYYKAKNDGCDCNGYDAPKATVGLYGMGGNFDSATCTINTKGTASNVVYTFARSNMDASGQVFNEQTFGQNGDSRVYLGTNAEATQLVVTFSEQTYTFTLVNSLKATLEY